MAGCTKKGIARSPFTAAALALASVVVSSGFVVVSVSLATTSVVACSPVALRGVTDANPDPEVVPISTENCPTKPVAFCDAMAPSALGCTGEPELGDAAPTSGISTDVSYPLGCKVNVPSTYPTPQGECLVAYACKCTSPGARTADAGGGLQSSSQWSCIR